MIFSCFINKPLWSSLMFKSLRNILLDPFWPLFQAPQALTHLFNFESQIPYLRDSYPEHLSCLPTPLPTTPFPNISYSPLILSLSASSFFQTSSPDPLSCRHHHKLNSYYIISLSSLPFFSQLQLTISLLLPIVLMFKLNVCPTS